MYNNPADNEICQSRLHQPTKALHEKQFTTIGLTQTSNSFVAQKANRMSIKQYDHAIGRYMENTVIEEDENTSTQLTEKIFIKSEHVFVINSMKKNYDNFFLHRTPKHQSL